MPIVLRELASGRRWHVCAAGLLVLTVLVAGLGGKATPFTQAAAASAPAWPAGAIHVRRAALVDSLGRTGVLRGGQIAGCYIDAKQFPSGPDCTFLDDATFRAMDVQWAMNELRIQVSPDLWQLKGPGFLDDLAATVARANAHNLVVVLSADETGSPSVRLPTLLYKTFWGTLAGDRRFGNRPGVIFDLFNEPIPAGMPMSHRHDPPTPAQWEQLLHGTIVSGVHYLGWQQLIDAIRATGAGNPIVAEAVMSGTLQGIEGHLPSDSNVILSLHDYNNFDLGQFSKMDLEFGNISASHAVFMGEWGDSPADYFTEHCKMIPHDQLGPTEQRFARYMDGHQVSWNAFRFMTGNSHLIVDGTTYAPTQLTGNWRCDRGSPAGIGQIVFDDLHGQ